MSKFKRRAARSFSYLIALLLAAVWTVGALESFTFPLFDLARPGVGETILAVAKSFALPSDGVFMFAKLLAGLKFMIGAFLLVAAVGGVWERVKTGSCDDATLDVALFIAAIASLVGTLPGLLHGGALLQGAVGELMLCVIASWLAIYGRGFIIAEERPRPARPQFGYVRAN